VFVGVGVRAFGRAEAVMVFGGRPRIVAVQAVGEAEAVAEAGQGGHHSLRQVGTRVDP